MCKLLLGRVLEQMNENLQKKRYIFLTYILIHHLLYNHGYFFCTIYLNAVLEDTEYTLVIVMPSIIPSHATNSFGSRACALSVCACIASYLRNYILLVRRACLPTTHNSPTFLAPALYRTRSVSIWTSCAECVSRMCA